MLCFWLDKYTNKVVVCYNMEQMEEVVLCTQVRERESHAANKITSVHGAKRVAQMTHGINKKHLLSKMSKGQLHQFVKEIQKACNQT